jgi:hypothetical protein
VRAGVVVDRDADGVRAIGRRDAGRHAVARLDRDREGGAEGRGVVALGHHHRQPQLRDPVFRQREADEAAPVLGHEVDRLGRDRVGGHAQVALVLAVLVVGQDDLAAGADLGDADLDGDDHVGPVGRDLGALRATLQPQGRTRVGHAACLSYGSRPTRSARGAGTGQRFRRLLPHGNRPRQIIGG